MSYHTTLKRLLASSHPGLVGAATVLSVQAVKLYPSGTLCLLAVEVFSAWSVLVARSSTNEKPPRCSAETKSLGDVEGSARPARGELGGHRTSAADDVNSSLAGRSTTILEQPYCCCVCYTCSATSAKASSSTGSAGTLKALTVLVGSAGLFVAAVKLWQCRAAVVGSLAPRLTVADDGAATSRKLGGSHRCVSRGAKHPCPVFARVSSGTGVGERFRTTVWRRRRSRD